MGLILPQGHDTTLAKESGRKMKTFSFLSFLEEKIKQWLAAAGLFKTMRRHCL